VDDASWAIAEPAEVAMSIWKLIPARIHGVLDFASAFALIAFAVLVGGSGLAVATGIVLGGVLIAVSLLTDYPLGLLRVIPFKVHSAGDYLGAASLIVAPFLLGFSGQDATLSVLYVATGVALVGVSLATDYEHAGSREPAIAGQR
jgi:hypothetical protein